MNSWIDKSKAYLGEVLGIEIVFLPWKEQTKLPFFLIDAYYFFQISLLNNVCLLMIAKNETELTPNTIQKHWEQVTKLGKTPCIYVSNAISSYNRKRLIQHHIPFIIPANQMYIPDLGVDLREHFKKQRVHKTFFSPATQTVILFALLRDKNERLIPSVLANTLGYSPMTMTRGFNELETAGVGRMISKGKEREWIFEGAKKELWEQTKEMLRSPVKRREWMKLWPKIEAQTALAGISALAETTRINAPQIPVFAIGLKTYLQTNHPKGLQFAPADEAKFELEIWHYDPQLFSAYGRVDPFSLYLSLRDTNDERIEAALETLMETIKW